MITAPSTASDPVEPTRQGGRLPDFLLIGAAKAGTTTLHRYFLRHPGIFMCDPKEPGFFCRDEFFGRGMGWYRALFATAKPSQVCGEASTTYTRWPHTADAATRIAREVPDAKLIYIVRHPVDRAYSHYAHHMRTGVTMTFEEALERSSIYVDCSLYMDQLDRYLAAYPRERLLCLLTEDLRKDAGAVLERIQQFLAVEPLDLTAAGEVRENVSGSETFVRSRTTQLIRRIPGGSLLADLLPPGMRGRIFRNIARSPVGRRLQREFHLPPMQPATRQMLVERFREPNARLSAFLGRDLSHWNQ